ncbi:MAG: alpha/beta hydrolase, partial [Gudongella sp.]|nr:alpha/beta hydrolase [Gudongella sp.]
MNEMRAVKRMGSSIKYWLYGEGGNPVVVLTHGATLDHMSFKDQIPALVRNGYMVLAWDMRGHGASVPMGRKATLQVHMEDILAIMDHAGVAKATLVGHSLGGFVSQLFTFQHPERV